MPKKTAYIALGSNLGDRRAFIDKALKMLTENNSISVSRLSDIIETAPLGGANQPSYLNAVAEVRTALSAEALHKKMAGIETSLGRDRKAKWSPRVIDLDLLLFGDEIVNNPDLTIPHPQMHLRSFVLKGLCQLSPKLLHPVIKQPIDELAGRLGSADFVLDPELPQLVSIAGIIGVGKTTLTEKLSKLLGGQVLFEAYDKNPFLPDVYAGRKELALDSQIFFLTSRISQLNPGTLPKGQIIISDYVFNKELIYARRLLDAQQLSLYEQIYAALSTEIAKPVLVIYLTDSAEVCLQRIHSRNRPYEQAIQLQFLKALDEDYQQLFADWKICPVIRLSVSKFNAGEEERLTEQIKSYIAV